MKLICVPYSQKIPRQNRFMQCLMKTESWSLWHIFSNLTPTLKICRRQLSLFLQEEATNIFRGLKGMWLALCLTIVNCWLSSYGGSGQWLPAVVKTLNENYSSKIRKIKHNQLRPTPTLRHYKEYYLHLPYPVSFFCICAVIRVELIEINIEKLYTRGNDFGETLHFFKNTFKWYIFVFFFQQKIHNFSN